MSIKKTSPKVARKASSTIKDKSSGKSTKTAAGSALSQVSPKKVTSAKASSAASKVLRDARTSASSKSVAASALSQKSTGKKSAADKPGTSSGGPRRGKK